MVLAANLIGIAHRSATAGSVVASEMAFQMTQLR